MQFPWRHPANAAALVAGAEEAVYGTVAKQADVGQQGESGRVEQGQGE
jgi:hypothetical protein